IFLLKGLLPLLDALICLPVLLVLGTVLPFSERLFPSAVLRLEVRDLPPRLEQQQHVLGKLLGIGTRVRRLASVRNRDSRRVTATENASSQGLWVLWHEGEALNSSHLTGNAL